MGARTLHRKRNSRWFKFVGAGAGIAIAAGATGWAIGVTLVGGGPVADETEQSVWVQAEESSIGSALNLSTTVKQPVRVVASNHLTGVVSAVDAGEKKLGDKLYSVAGKDVYVIQGGTPFYQDIAPKSSGQNVKQFEGFLKSLDFFAGTPDGIYDAATAQAIKAWQRSTGQKPDGVIELGRVVAISSLPAQIELAEAISPGKQLAGGEDAVMAASGKRTFTLSLTTEQAAMIPQDSVVEVQHEKSIWKAVIAQTSSEDSGNVVHTLSAQDGAEVCGAQCADLPSGSNVTLRSKVIVVPATSGIGIPAAAITTDPSGQAQVTTESGSVNVTVLASGQGIVIVDGLDAGAKVRVLEASPKAP